VFADRTSNNLVMKYVPVLTDVAVGDVVLTSGLDQVFPKGLVIGRVASVGGTGLFRDVVVTPSARFDRLEEVLVLSELPTRTEITETVQ
jgi:rod shape-determining protein MreC